MSSALGFVAGKVRGHLGQLLPPLLARVGIAKILPSWLAPITTAEPARYPASTGVDSSRATTASRSDRAQQQEPRHDE